MIRVLLVDDHVVLHRDLKRHLERRGGIEVIGVAGDGATGVRLAAALAPDVVIMDLMLRAEMSGIEATRAMIAACASCRVVAFTGSDDVRVMQEARRAGMVGYVRKAGPDNLIEAVEAAARGDTSFPADMKPADGATHGPRGLLTAREWEVLRHLAGGLAIKEVAILLHLSPDGVEYHIHEMKRRLGLTSDVALIKFAVQVGATTLDL